MGRFSMAQFGGGLPVINEQQYLNRISYKHPAMKNYEGKLEHGYA